MGRVLLVRDHHLDREVALKVLHQPPSAPEDLERVRIEFGLLAGLEHPGIARAFDFGWLRERPFFTSEFIPGEPLAARGLLSSAEEILQTAADLAEPLAFLHRGEVLHLDLKPSNVIVSSNHRPARLVLIDFGLLRRGSAAPPGTKVRGSLPYLAPEYFRSGGTLGPWTDVYALGVTLFRMATGSFPRTGPLREGAVLSGDSAWEPAPPSPSGLGAAVSPGLEKILFRCLALDPRSRFPSAVELQAALRRLSGSGPAMASGWTAPAAAIGRSAELTRAEGFLQLVEKGEPAPAALLVTGRRGMGQTHFLRQLKVRAQLSGFGSYLETGFPGGAATPGSLLRPLAVHLAEEDRAAGARWSRFLARLRRPSRPSRAEASEGERRLRRAEELASIIPRVRKPLLLAVDGLEHADEISIALLVDLVRLLGERSGRERPPIAIVAGYREEGPAAALLRELTACLLRPGKGWVITLGPLGLEDTLALYRQATRAAGKNRGTGEEPPLAEPSGLALFQETGGCPAAILALAAQRQESRPVPEAPAKAPVPPPGLDREDRELLLALELLGRPARPVELARIVRRRAAAVRRCLGALNRLQLIRALEPESGQDGWVAEASSATITAGATPALRRSIHGRIARALIRSAAVRGGPAIAEAVHHFRAQGRSREVARYGMLAARHLKAGSQNRAALEMLRAVSEAIPAGRRRARLETALEMAELHARVGDLDEGIRILRELLPEVRNLPRSALRRATLRLATLYSRRGDFQRADLLFREGFPAGRGGGEALGRKERLYFINERAALKAGLGEYSEALRLCGEGLRLAANTRDPGIREVSLNLHATRANVALRNYDYPAAVLQFETALEIAEAIGSTANQATVLNNLGVVYSQLDRFSEAVRAFQDAERACLRLDEGPSLASIYGNLAVLHAKRGGFEAMESALEKGDRLVPASIGRRQELFLAHARGLCLLLRGRPAEARRRLEAAIRLGHEIGDRHLADFDEVYRAEALIFEAAPASALEELERLSAAGPPARIRRMALARAAFAAALSGRTEDVDRAAARYSELASQSPVPYLDAWDGLYLAWALGTSGKREAALTVIERAESYFRRHRLQPALALARLVKAEIRLAGGEWKKARELLSDPGGRFPHRTGPAEGDLAAVLQPLLSARLVLEDGPAADRALAADLVAEAGAALVGNPIPEWEARVGALRSLLNSGGRGQVPERPTGSDTALIPRPEPGPRRIVARSPGMRRLVSTLARLRKSDLPVLILGETGTGKELVARSIHRESRRAAKPFQVIDCATIPAGLLEAELFGARAGAFTDLNQDRPGILELAEGGTVLVDEIAGAPLEVQGKLLRVLSEKTRRPLGAAAEVKVDVRFLFASSRDLEREVREGRLRPDLLHRIQVVTVEVPPLRERAEDIPELVQAILAGGEGPAPELGEGVLDALWERPWPGNVRELENLLARLRLENSRRIAAAAVEAAGAGSKSETLFPSGLLAREGLSALRDRLEREYLLFHLRRLGGDSRALSRFLGMDRRGLYRACKRAGISLRTERRREGRSKSGDSGGWTYTRS